MDQEISALIALLGDAQYDAYKLAAKKLRRIGLPAAPALRELLDSTNPVLATRAARLLGEIGDIEAVPLLRALDTDGLPDLASAISTALAQLRRASATAETTRIAVADVQLRQAVKRQREGTDVWKPPHTESLGEKVTRPTLSTQRRLELTLPMTIDGLIATLSSQDYSRRLAATNALVERGSEAVPALVNALKGGSAMVRLRALDALGKIGDDTALPAVARFFVEARNAQDWETASAALAVLSDDLSSRARPELLDGYIDLVRIRTHPGSTWLPIGPSIEGAKCLEAIASAAPGPELRRALTYLKGIRPFVPAEFVRARVAIENATAAWSALPLPAEEPAPTVQNLPTPASESSLSIEALPLPTESAPPRVRKRPPTLPKDAPSLLKMLSVEDNKTARLAEGALMLRVGESLSEICGAFDTESSAAQQAIVRILCAHPSPYALPTLERARKLFPENATLRRTLEKLRT